MSWETAVPKRRRAPGARDRGSLPRLAPSASHCLPPAHTPAEEQPSAGRIKWTSSNHVYSEDRGGGASALTARTHQSPVWLWFFFFFNLFKIMCVNQAWWPVPVIPSLRRLRQARPCLRGKKNDFHKADLSLQISLSVPVPGLSRPPGHIPRPSTFLLCLNVNFPMVGH